MNTKTGKNIPSMQSDRHFLTPVIPQYSLLASESSWFYLYFFSVFFLLWHSCTPTYHIVSIFFFFQKKFNLNAYFSQSHIFFHILRIALGFIFNKTNFSFILIKIQFILLKQISFYFIYYFLKNLYLLQSLQLSQQTFLHMNPFFHIFYNFSAIQLDTP